MYGCNYGLVPNDILMKAMEMAYQAGMDVINLSLGIHGGWEEEALAIMANRIVAQGVHGIIQGDFFLYIFLTFFLYSCRCQW